MTIPKKKYRDKVRARLETARALLGDKDRVAEMLKRVHGPVDGMREKLEALDLLLGRDVPSLLDALDSLTAEDTTDAR